MEVDNALGIASGVYRDFVNGKLVKVIHDRRSTPKALMLFRKRTYEDIGGFIPMKYGGEDTIACYMARMKNWKTWSFPNLVAIHNKQVGTGRAKNILKIRFQQGIGERSLATHPLFFFLKALRRCLIERPFVLGGLSRMIGYIDGYFTVTENQIPYDVVRFIRREQFYRVLKGNRIPNKYRVVDPRSQ
jgi:hypothetical protein